MTRRLGFITIGLGICALAHAASIGTTLAVTNGSGGFGSGMTMCCLNGPASLTAIGNGTLSGSLSPDSSGNQSGTISITLSGGDRINMTFSLPATAVSTSSFTTSATVTGGTGAYAGATGSFPNLSGSASPVAFGGFSFSFSGAGTINTPGAGPVTITDILDAGGYSKAIAQGSIFVVKGSNLSGAGYTAFSLPWQTTSGGVRVTFTPAAGGSGTDAYLVYLYNQGGVNQIAAVVPSTLATGNYNVTVANNGNTSAPFATQVVQRKFGLMTVDGSGSGLALVQNYISASQLDLGRMTTYSAGGNTFSPARPGQTLIAWGTGMGPVSGGDNVASTGYDFAANGVNVQVLVGGAGITPMYAGRTPGLAGTDQINFTLPANVPTGCAVSLQVSVNGVLSNPTYIAIAPSNSATACVQPGFTTDQLARLDQGGSYTAGSFNLTQLTETVPESGPARIDSASGQFVRFSGFQFAGLAQYQTQHAASGACSVTHTTNSSGAAAPTTAWLDPGNVTLSGPSGSGLTAVPFKLDIASNAYSIALGTEGMPVPGGLNATLVVGVYTVNGAGGKDIGKFNVPLPLGTPLSIAGGLPSTVVRGAGLTLNWSGGIANDVVEIYGGTSTDTDTWSFTCMTTAGANTFTVPSSILTQIPAAAAGGSGILAVISGPMVGFSAPLVAGGNIDVGTFAGLVGASANPAWQ
jgi:uncharacterized protein (TIGR03437 family)